METGIVKKWFPECGYGFIVSDSNGEDVFVHARDLLFSEDSMRRGVRVRFSIGEREGKRLAWNVQEDLKSARSEICPSTSRGEQRR